MALRYAGCVLFFDAIVTALKYLMTEEGGRKAETVEDELERERVEGD